jgi:hypothetical protein
MLSLLAVVTFALGQAEPAFKTLLDLDTDWSGKITIHDQQVIVNRLHVAATQLPCKACTVSALGFAFQFEGDFRFPSVPANERPKFGGGTLPDFFKAVEPDAFRVQAAYHGDKGVPMCSGSELVLRSWSARKAANGVSEFEFELQYYLTNSSVASKSMKLTGILAIKSGHVEGTLSGKDVPPVKFVFAPIAKDKPDKVE